MTRIMISIDPGLHQSMRELSIRRKHNVGVEYERAIQLYLNRVENYLGMKPKTQATQPKTKGIKNNGNQESTDKKD